MAGNFLVRSRHGTIYYFRRRVPLHLQSINSRYLDVFADMQGHLVVPPVKEQVAIAIVIQGEPVQEYVGFTGRALRAWEDLFTQLGIPFSSIHAAQ
jgi:hypothetical protein